MSRLIDVRNTDATISVGGLGGDSGSVRYGGDWDRWLDEGYTGYRITPDSAGLGSNGLRAFYGNLSADLDWDSIVSDDYYQGPPFADNTSLNRRSSANLGPGNDTLQGTRNVDILRGADGDDVVRGGDNNDTLYGDGPNSSSSSEDGPNPGNDTLEGDNGKDSLYGGPEDDELNGGNDNDQLFGEDGADRLFGENGSDSLFGGNGPDQLSGGPRGGGWTDVLEGGEGADLFYLNYNRIDEVDDPSWWDGYDESVIAQAGKSVAYSIVKALTDQARSHFFKTLPGGALLGALPGAAGGSVEFALEQLMAKAAAANVPKEGDALLIVDFDPREDVLFVPQSETQFLTASTGYVQAPNGQQGFGARFHADDNTYAYVFLDEEFLAEFNINSSSPITEAFLNDVFQSAMQVDAGGLDTDRYTYPTNGNSYTDGTPPPQYDLDEEFLLKTGNGIAATMFGAFAPLYNFTPSVTSSIIYIAGTNMGDIVSANATGFAPEDFRAPENQLATTPSLIKSFGGDDIVLGGNAQDVLYGGEGDDELYSFRTLQTSEGLLEEFVYGGEGDDTLWGSGTRAVLDGGADEDTADFSLSRATVSIYSDLLLGTAYETGSGANAENIYTFASIERVVGTANDDTLKGGAEVSIQVGQNGDDTIVEQQGLTYASYAGNDGRVHVDLGAGVAREYAANGGTIIYTDSLVDVRGAIGTDYNDEFLGRSRSESFVGGSGNDTYSAGDGDNTIIGGNGKNIVDTGNGDDVISVGDGDDVIDADNGANTIDAGDGANSVFTRTGDDFIETGDGNDTILSGGGNDTISSDGGNDSIDAAAGNDSISAGDGNDTAYGGDGADTITAGSGTNFLYGEDGNDRITSNGSSHIEGGSGADNLTGSNSRDTIEGGSGNDTISGRSDPDLINGGTGADSLDGGEHDDTLDGGEGDDIVHGSSGNDSLLGGDGDDTLDPGTGMNTLEGGAGDDLFIGADNYNVMIGGKGADRADFSSQSKGMSLVLNNDRHYGRFESIEQLVATDRNDYVLWLNDASLANSPIIVDGGAGNDTLSVFTLEATPTAIIGGTGNDELSGGEQTTYKWAIGDGNDSIAGTSGAQTLELQLNTGPAGEVEPVSFSYNEGNGVLTVVAGQDGETTTATKLTSIVIYEAEAGTPITGAEQLLAAGISLTVIGTVGGEEMDFQNAPSSTARLTLIGVGADDTLIGGDGNDWLDGGPGGDQMFGGGGNDRAVYSDADAAVKVSLDDPSQNEGDAAGDIFDSIEWIEGSRFDDVLIGDANDNWIFGQKGNDDLSGLEGGDRLTGQGGNDTLDGGSGNDTLRGGRGDDSLLGGEDNDQIFGDVGNDDLSGGAMADVFEFTPGDGIDLIRDMASEDIVELRGFGFTDFSEVAALLDTNDNGDAVLRLSSEQAITFEGVSVASLTSDQFELVG